MSLAEILADWGFLVVAALVGFQIARRLYAWTMTLWIQGKPNEWVVIMNNGQQKAAGIGLSTFCGPFD